MEIQTCRQCRKIFNYTFGPKICPVCREKLEEKFNIVKEYIWDHKGAGIKEVSEECDVDQKLIRQWVREERLELSGSSDIVCESCGTSIATGRFCNKCKLNISSDLHSLIKKEEKVKPERKNDSPKMRFFNN